jgi:hypothetical protein
LKVGKLKVEGQEVRSVTKPAGRTAFSFQLSTFNFQLANLQLAMHYEAAFEDYLRARGVPYVVADQTHRAILADSKIKSFDFLVYGAGGVNLLIDVKGRRARSAGPGRAPALQNWVTRGDIDGLSRWQEVFGPGFRAVLMFAFWLGGEPALPADGTDPAAATPADKSEARSTHRFRGAIYRFRGVRLDDYVRGMRVRSPKWETVCLPAGFFRDYSRPADDFL